MTTFVIARTAPAVVQTVRYNGGHWIAVTTYNATLATIQAAINAAPAIITGIELLITWAQMEGAQGDYRVGGDPNKGFQYLDTILGYCAAKTTARGSYFGCMIYINGDGSGNYPSYLDNAGFDGGNGTYQVPGTGQPRVPCFWRTAVINAIVARDQAYLSRYDTNANFEMHGGPRGETSATYNVTGGPGYSNAAWQNAWATWLTAVSPYAVHAQIRVLANFMTGSWSAMDTLIQQCITARCAMGGPDVYTRFIKNTPQPYPADFGMVVNGYTFNGTVWVQNGTNYVSQGKLCLIYDAQAPEMGGKENQAAFPAAADLYAQAVANSQHYCVWFQHNSCWGSPYNANKQLYWDNTVANTTGESNGHFTPDIKTYLTSNNVPLNMNRPGYYS